MTKPLLRVGAISLALALALVTVPLKAQLVVSDPMNYIEAVLQYEQLIRQYEFLIQQAMRVPVDLESRYHAYSLEWTYHDPSGVLYAQPLLVALNTGDASGRADARGPGPPCGQAGPRRGPAAPAIPRGLGEAARGRPRRPTASPLPSRRRTD